MARSDKQRKAASPNAEDDSTPGSWFLDGVRGSGGRVSYEAAGFHRPSGAGRLAGVSAMLHRAHRTADSTPATGPAVRRALRRE